MKQSSLVLQLSTYCIMFAVKQSESHGAALWIFSLFYISVGCRVVLVINHVSVSSWKAPDTLITPYTRVFSHNNLALSCRNSLASDLCASAREHSRAASAPLAPVFHFTLYQFISSLCSPLLCLNKPSSCVTLHWGWRRRCFLENLWLLHSVWVKGILKCHLKKQIYNICT